MEQFCKVYVYEEIKHSIVSNNWIQLACTHSKHSHVNSSFTFGSTHFSSHLYKINHYHHHHAFKCSGLVVLSDMNIKIQTSPGFVLPTSWYFVTKLATVYHFSLISFRNQKAQFKASSI